MIASIVYMFITILMQFWFVLIIAMSRRIIFKIIFKGNYMPSYHIEMSILFLFFSTSVLYEILGYIKVYNYIISLIFPSIVILSGLIFSIGYFKEKDSLK